MGGEIDAANPRAGREQKRDVDRALEATSIYFAVIMCRSTYCKMPPWR
jgi:hypothetical protein